MEEKETIEQKEEENVNVAFGIEDKIYRLEEMVDAMEASMNNIDEVANQQERLSKIVKDSGDTSFEKFLKETDKQIDNLKEQKETLSKRINCLKDVLIVAKDNNVVKTALNVFMAGIGMFEE